MQSVAPVMVGLVLLGGMACGDGTGPSAPTDAGTADGIGGASPTTPDAGAVTTSTPDAGGSSSGPCLPRVVGSGSSPLIDDFEDGDLDTSPVDGRRGILIPYTDATGTATLTSVPGGAPGSALGTRFNGSGTVAFGTGLGVLMNGPTPYVCPFDASNYLGVGFWARAASGPSSIGVTLNVASDETCHRVNPPWECWDLYITSVTVDTTWRRYELLWQDFTGFALSPQAISRPPGNIENLYQVNLASTNPVGDFEFELDDLAFLEGSCGSGVCNPARPCPSDCCGNGSCDAHEFGTFAGGEEKVVRGPAYCASDCPIQAACPAADLGSQVPQTISGDTARATDDITLNCNMPLGAPLAPELEYVFTAPEAGTYLFNATSTAFEPRVVVLDGVCTGGELSCGLRSNNLSGAYQAGVSVPLGAGQAVTVVVENAFGGSGPFALEISRLAGECPDEDLGSTLPVNIAGTTTGKLNTVASGVCGDVVSPDHTYTWTAPSAGLFDFSVTGATFPGVLELRDATCGGAALGCAESFGAAATARRSVTLAQGQTVAVTVDGYAGSGDYSLAIQAVSCPNGDLGATAPVIQQGSTAGLPDAVTGACLFQSGGSDVAFTWTAPEAGTYVFDTAGSNFDTVLSVLDGNACNGAPLACNDDTLGAQSRVQLALDADQQVIVVVDGYSATAFGDYVLEIAACPAAGDAGVPVCPE